MKIARIRVLALAALLAAVLAVPALAAEPVKNVILISWDGVQREHLKECLSRKELPNLAALIKEGTIVDIEVTHTTDTKAGHAQMLTGYDPATTGVFSNSKFKPIPAGYTIFERLENTLGKNSIATVMLTSKTHHIGNCPPRKAVDPKTLDPGYFPGKDNPAATAGTSDKADTTAAKPRKPGAKAAAGAAAKANTARVQNNLGEPWYLVYKNMDVWDGEKSRVAGVTGPLALGYLDKYGKGRFFAFFHFSDPDHMGHQHGENSKEVNDSYILCDRWLGEIVKKLKAMGIYEDTRIYVNSDHGFDEGLKTHKKAPTVFLATNDRQVVSGGNQRDIVPTLLSRMGVDCTKFQPKYPGKPLTAK